MAPEKVIPDSDDDSDGEVLLSPEKLPADPPSLSEVGLNNGTSQPDEQSALQEHNTNSTATSSTTRLMRTLHSAQKAVAGPTPTPQHQNIAAPGLEWNSSRSPTISKVNRRQTTMGIVESQREEDAAKSKRRKTLKMYGSYSKRSQAPSSSLDEDMNDGGFEYDGKSRKRLRLESPAQEDRDDAGLPSTEDGRVPPELEGFFTYGSKSGGDQLNLETSEYTTSKEHRAAGAELSSNSIVEDLLIGQVSVQDVGQAGESRGLQSPSINSALGVFPSRLEFAGPASNLAVDLRSTVTLSHSQKQQYEYLDGSMETPTEQPNFSPIHLMQELWGKDFDASSTFPIASDERYHSQLTEIEKTMEDSSELQLEDVANKGPKRIPGRSKSMWVDFPSQNIAQSSSPVRAQPNRRTKTSLSRGESETPILSIDRLALPPSVKEKTEKKPNKRGRKPKTQADGSLDELASDELVVGLPKEQNKPRPSHSRSTTHDEPIVEEPKTSPKKGSGLDSDEIAAISLPKEQYKPRPSRSRGDGKAAEVFESLDFAKPKKKYKRGITTGHILKMKIVDSDDEDEVIYVEERPRKDKDERVSLERIKAEIIEKPNKQDAKDAAPAYVPEDVEFEGTTSQHQPKADNTLLANVLDVIPPENQPSELKKRGRKRKQTTDSSTVSVDMQHPTELPPSQELPIIAEENAPTQRKKRGRKRKQTIESVSEADEPDANEIPPIQKETTEIPKRGRKRKRTIESASETEERDENEIPPTQEDAAEDPEPIAADAPIPEPKKRGQRRKKTTNLGGERHLVDDTEDASTSLDKSLKEKDPNTKPAAKSTGERTTSRLSVESSQNPDDNYEGELEAIMRRTQSESIHPVHMNPLETPTKGNIIEVENGNADATDANQGPKATDKGPTKHSPINKSKVKFRVGLSKTARIAPLLKSARK